MICFSDTDIFLKLIAFGLMEQALDALNVKHEEVYVTPEATSKCHKSKRYNTDFREATLKQALDFLKKVRVISKAGDPTELDLLLDVEDMDTGETTLFLATKGERDFLLLTSDKRALRSLTNNFLNQDLHNRHKGRVVCLEALVLLIIRQEGFPRVQNKLRSEQNCDKAIKKALRDGAATASEFIATLQGYVSRLDQETQGLLWKPSGE